MEIRPPWDPYDAILALDQLGEQHRGQILELARSQTAQSRQIQALIKSNTEIRQEILDLREQLVKTMQLQIDALHEINQAKNIDSLRD